MRSLALACLALAAFAQSPGPAIVVGADAGAGGGLTPPATITQSAIGSTALTGVSLDGSTTPFWQYNSNNANFDFGAATGGVLRFHTTALANSPPAAGTLIGGNLPAAAAGNIFDFQRNGSGWFRLTSAGIAHVSNFNISTTAYSPVFTAAQSNNGRVSLYNGETTGQAATNGTMGIPYFRAGAAPTTGTAVSIITPSVTGAMYRLAYYCYVTTTDAARTATVTLNWTDNTGAPGPVAQSATLCNAMSTATMGTFVQGHQIVVTNTAAITYTIAYTGGTTGAITFRHTLERLQ